MGFISILLLGQLVVSNAMAERKENHPINDDFQRKVVQLYSDGKCADVKTLIKGINYRKLRPNVMAIVAYCEPDDINPEALFLKAEEVNPTGDLIYLMHGKYLWKKDPASAEPLWEKVLSNARNQHFRDLARDFKAGVVSREAEAEPLDLSPDTAFARILIAGTYQSNPGLPEIKTFQTRPTYGTKFAADISLRHWTNFGSIAANFVSSYDRFILAPQLNFLKTDLGTPIAIHVTPTKDIVFEPLITYSQLGSDPYAFTYGIKIGGEIYSSEFLQTLKAIIFARRIFPAVYSAQEGAHYRFEYNWEFFPTQWALAAHFAFEHVSATSTTKYLGSTGFFEMSHNDLNLQFKVERDFADFSIGVIPSANFRADTQASRYTDVFGNTTFKLRNDWEVATLVDVSFPILPYIQLYGWYEWRQVYSDLAVGDYVNRDSINHTVGIGIRTSISTY